MIIVSPVLDCFSRTIHKNQQSFRVTQAEGVVTEVIFLTSLHRLTSPAPGGDKGTVSHFLAAAFSTGEEAVVKY